MLAEALSSAHWQEQATIVQGLALLRAPAVLPALCDVLERGGILPRPLAVATIGLVHPETAPAEVQRRVREFLTNESKAAYSQFATYARIGLLRLGEFDDTGERELLQDVWWERNQAISVALLEALASRHEPETCSILARRFQVDPGPRCVEDLVDKLQAAGITLEGRGRLRLRGRYRAGDETSLLSLLSEACDHHSALVFGDRTVTACHHVDALAAWRERLG